MLIRFGGTGGCNVIWSFSKEEYLEKSSCDAFWSECYNGRKFHLIGEILMTQIARIIHRKSLLFAVTLIVAPLGLASTQNLKFKVKD